MTSFQMATRLAMGTLVLAAVTTTTTACWETGGETVAEGNYDIAYTDMMRVYWDDELIAEIDQAQGGTLVLGELEIDYDEFCSDPAYSCPSEVMWDEVAIEQPLGESNALINAVNIGTIGEPGTRLAGLMDEQGAFTLLLGLSASYDENCMSVGVSTAEGSFSQSLLAPSGTYDGIDTAAIRVTYAAGCEILQDTIIGGSLTFEMDFNGTRTGDLDLGEIEPDPPVDETGEPVEDSI
jgi:hypothetical protein